ncbi:MAG: hypothetical protein M1830_009720 [Pleopsidium flavum]|nr:MAG: hypothetical protein M1830_009720 [Pleopsidium flavum]
MPSSDSDHNYYTRGHSRQHSQHSDHAQSPHGVDSTENLQCNPTPSSPGDQITTLPAYTYSQPLQTPPKRPSISTNFESYASDACLNGFICDPPADDNSPDPHDFYRPYRDPFTEALSGHRDIVVPGREAGMATSAYQRKPNSISARANGTASKHAPIPPRSSARPPHTSASPPSSNNSPLSAAKSSPNLFNTARARQTSLKDLVNKFNQTPNEKPLLPSKPGARLTSASVNPAGRAHNYARARTPSHSKISGAGDSTQDSKSGRDQSRNPSRSTQPRNYANDGVQPSTKPAQGRVPQSVYPQVSGNASASQSMSDLSQFSPSKELFRPRLFGEILSLDMNSPDPGYGIPGPRRRRGSEGSMHSPNPMFPSDRSDLESGISPSSPTAWYMGLTPSLDDVRTDRPTTSRPPGMHRRARSDFNGITSRPLTASALGMHVSTVSPTPEVQAANVSPPGSQRNSQSRLPLSTRRVSITSDSGNSIQSSRTNSAMGRASAHKPTPKGMSSLPRPSQRPTSPASKPRVSPSRSSPRRRNCSPSSHRSGTSPHLNAYISAPLPKKSPPLRSSRPRQPVSSASTSASRAKAVERLGTNKHSLDKDLKETKPKKLPELGGIDFAARRQRIQQAFTKTVQENERKEVIKAEQKRIAKQKEEEARQNREQSEVIEVREVQNREDQGGLMANQPIEEGVKKSPSRDEFETPVEDSTPDERHLTLDTTNIPRRFSHLDLTRSSAFDNDDSPTLGIPGSFPGPDATVDRSQSPESETDLLSAVTAGTADTEDTVIDNEPQTDRPEPNAGHGTILSQVMRMRAASPSRSEAADDSLSDRDDQESIQIMLRATPVVEAAGVSIEDELQDEPQYEPQDEPQDGELREVFSNEGPDDRWSTTSWGSSVPDQQSLDRVRDPPMERIDEYSPPQPEESAHSSFSTSAGNQTPQPWNPTDFSTPRTARSTLDSETYSTINRVLEHYHDPSLLTPQMVHDFQQQLLIQSPELARQGGWDPKRVTQLYLQELARGRLTSGSAVPGPLNLGLRRRFQPQEPLGTDQPGAESADAENDDSEEVEDTDHGYELSESGWSSQRPSLDVDSSELKPQRASLNHPDDWAHTSPSILDWIHPQAADSPVEERREPDYRPTPPPKEWRSMPPRPDVSDRIPRYLEPAITSREGSETPRLSADNRPRLPEIKGTGEGLGLAIHVESPQDDDSPTIPPPPPLPNYSPPLPPSVPPISEIMAAQAATTQSPPSPSLYSKHPPSSIFPNVFPDGVAAGPSTRSSGDSSQQHGIATPPAQTSGSSSHSEERVGLDGSSQSSEAPGGTTLPTPDQKRLTKRGHIIKELVDTENSFSQDMTVVVDIYKSTSGSCVGLSGDDVKTLFGNSDQIMKFSAKFLNALKQASKSVYVIPKSSRWRNKRGSSSTSNSANTDDQSSVKSSDLTDEEKDRKTFIGEAFGQHITDMEKVYSDYLRNHDSANKKLRELMNQNKMVVWLKECRTWASDLTSAWDLDSLLVKPMQRILKYPLLLGQLLEVTPENHPDFNALDVAVRETTGLSHRINETKRRAELVEQAVSSRKRKETDVRTGISKAFGRRTEKLRQQVGLSELFEDREYNLLKEKFSGQFGCLQVVMRDVVSYTKDVELDMSKFNELTVAIEGYIDVGPTTHPELESKWRRFRMSMREMSATALTEHVSEITPQLVNRLMFQITAVNKHVTEPMLTLLKLHDGPQKLMQKRDKRLMDYAKFKGIKDRGDKPDKKTQEQGDQFVALNDTLKDEIPKLFLLSRKMMQACLNNFVELQAQWHTIWRKKLSSMLDHHSLPKHISQIKEQFSADFGYAEASVLSLGICNGSMLADAVNLVSFLSPSTTLNGDGTSSPRRPSTINSSRHRGLSLNSDISPSLPHPDFGLRHSGSFTFSPIGEHAPPLPGSQHGPNQLSSNGRMRAGSGVSSRDPSTPDMSGGHRSFSVNTPASSNAARPSTGQGRSTEPSPSLPRLSVDTPAFNRLSADSPAVTRPASGSTYFSAAQDNVQASSSAGPHSSSFFSSALPMSDSPRSLTPVDGHSQKVFNVIFLAASVYEFNIDRARKEAGYPFLTYVAGEIFDVLGEKGELWLAKNQDDATNQVGWIWCKHFVKLST